MTRQFPRAWSAAHEGGRRRRQVEQGDGQHRFKRNLRNLDITASGENVEL